MIYRVTAQFKTATSEELRRKLDDGIAAQHPDGQEMVDSLHRAVVQDDGQVIWSEQCFCGSPLAHERATVLDHCFDDIVTEASTARHRRHRAARRRCAASGLGTIRRRDRHGDL